MGEQDMFHKVWMRREKPGSGKDGHGTLERIMGRNKGVTRGAQDRMDTYNQLEGGKTNNGDEKKGKRASKHDANEQQNTAKKSNTEPSNSTTKNHTNTINQIAKPKLMSIASPETKNK